MADIGKPVRTVDIPDPEEVPNEVPQESPEREAVPA
jgi:hypothetical protein